MNLISGRVELCGELDDCLLNSIVDSFSSFGKRKGLKSDIHVLFFIGIHLFMEW